MALQQKSHQTYSLALEHQDALQLRGSASEVPARRSWRPQAAQPDQGCDVAPVLSQPWREDDAACSHGGEVLNPTVEKIVTRLIFAYLLLDTLAAHLSKAGGIYD
jgi:hypothetical protein